MAHWLIFGGTFDPVHHGHLLTAQAAREQLGADEVLLVPAFVSPHKLDQQAATAADRLAMLRLATAGLPGFRIYTGELDRGGASYTADTLDLLHRDHPDTRLTLLIGADQLPKFHTWRRVRDILALAQIAVLGRPAASVSCAALQAALGPAEAQRLQDAVLPTPLLEISATDIRARVAAGQSIHFLVPPAVEAYIRGHGLYRTPTTSNP